MSDEAKFTVSQNLDIIPPKSGTAYPIPCAEWDHLKAKIALISDEALSYQNFGWLSLGGSLSTLIAILTGSFTVPVGTLPVKFIIAWAVFAVTLICGGFALFFASQQRKFTRVKASDVLEQMQIIEGRYPKLPTA